MNDDAALVELARSGDQSAFADLYERYFDRVYDFLARMVRDPSEAADLTQDTFLRAMNSLGSLTKGGSFKSWLFTIARNTALNRLERASRTQPLEGRNDAGEEQSYDVVDPDRFGNPEEAAEASGLASVVWEAAAALDPRYRSVLMLHVREGLDSAEIADVMGVTRNNASVLVNRMKAALGSAVGALALFRNGRRECAELDAVIARLQIGELTPDGRRAIERHAGSCEVCQEQRRKLASPFAILAGMGLVTPAAGVKAAIFGRLEGAFSMLAPEDAAASGAGGGGSSGMDGAGQFGNQAIGHWEGPPEADTSSLAGETSSPEGSGASGDVTLEPPPDGGHEGWSKRRIAVVGAASVLLLIAVLTAVLSFGGDDETALALLADETPAGEATETATPALPATAGAAGIATATATTEPAPTEAGDPGTPLPGETVLATGEQEPGLAPGGNDDNPPATEAVEPAPPEPGVSAPPSVTPDAGGPPAGSGSNLRQPDPPTVTPVPPSVTPVPPVRCTPGLSVTPRSLSFDRDTTTATLVLQAEGCGEALTFKVVPGANWITVTPMSDSIPDGGARTLAVTIDPGRADPKGSRIQIQSDAGTLEVPVNFDDGGCGVNCPPLRGP
jgi:RNA polymerase sigma factor (sigma-70 family)